MKERKHYVKYTIRGVTDSLRGHCRRYGRNFITVMYRIHKLGEDPIHAILSTDHRRNRNARHYKVCNRRGTLPELCKKFNVPPFRVAQRLKRGWSLKKALTTPPVNHGPYRVKTYTVDGLTGSLHQIILHLGCKVSKSTVYSRFKNQHIPLKKALAMPLKQFHYPKTTVKGITGTVPELCRHFKVVSSTTAYVRINNGWSIRDAVLRPAYSVSPRGRQKGNKGLLSS